MWVIGIMQVNSPMWVTNIMGKTTAYQCFVSFTSVDRPNREWVIQFFNVIIVHEKCPGSWIFILEVEDILR